MTKIGEQHQQLTFGKSLTEPISLREAIRQLSKKSKPPFTVVFSKSQKNRSASASCPKDDPNFILKWNGRQSTEGPMFYSWETKGLNPLATIMDWLGDVRTENDKGMTCGWGTGTCKTPTLVIWEDGKPECQTGPPTNPCATSVRTYVVNGGNCSSVISFNPNIKWTTPNVLARGLSGSKGGNIHFRI